jgi:hypothetical protein
MKYQRAVLLLQYKDINKSFGNAAEFRYLVTTVTNQKFNHKEINSRLNSGNACYHSVQNRLSSCLLIKNLKIKL